MEKLGVRKLQLVLINFLMVFASAVPAERSTSNDGIKQEEAIIRSFVGLTSTTEYKLMKWTKLKFHIDHSEFPDPEKVINAKLYLYKEPYRGHDQRPKDAEVVILQNQRRKDTIVAIGKITTATVGWLNFDVTSTVQKWIQEPNVNKGLDVWLQTYNHKGQTRKAIRFHGPKGKHKSTRPTLVIRYNLTGIDMDTASTSPPSVPWRS